VAAPAVYVQDALDCTNLAIDAISLRPKAGESQSKRLAHIHPHTVSFPCCPLSPYEALLRLSTLLASLADLSTSRIAARCYADLSLSKPIADSRHSPIIDLGSQDPPNGSNLAIDPCLLTLESAERSP
jgi:hypothetical protein